jgi:hypothetical protein
MPKRSTPWARGVLQDFFEDDVGIDVLRFSLEFRNMRWRSAG